MEEKSFVYWLQGFVELGDGKPLSEAQWDMIKEHLDLCFAKVTSGKPPDIQFLDTIGPADRLYC